MTLVFKTKKNQRDALGVDEMTLNAIEDGWLLLGVAEDDFMEAFGNNPERKPTKFADEGYIDELLNKEYERLKKFELEAENAEIERRDLERLRRNGEAAVSAEVEERKNSRDEEAVDADGFDWGAGQQVKEQLGLFGPKQEKPFALTSEPLTDAEKLARAQDDAKAKGLAPKRKAPVFQADKGIKSGLVGRQRGLFENDKGQIELEFEPSKKPASTLHGKQRVDMVDTGGRVAAASWVVGDVDAAATLLRKFKDSAQENLFLVTVDSSGKILEAFGVPTRARG